MSEKTPINPILGRIASLPGARNPRALKCIPVSCAPCASLCIPTIEFLEAFLDTHE